MSVMGPGFQGCFKIGLEFVFEKLLLHALDTSHLYDVSKHEVILNSVSDIKDEVEFMIAEIRDAIKYISEFTSTNQVSSSGEENGGAPVSDDLKDEL